MEREKREKAVLLLSWLLHIINNGDKSSTNTDDGPHSSGTSALASKRTRSSDSNAAAEVDSHPLENECKRKRCWVQPVNQILQEEGQWDMLMNDMRLWNTDMYFNNTRLTAEQFDLLLSHVGPLIKKNQQGREIISERARLALTLRHLATGDSLSTLSVEYCIGKSTACNIINETCAAIWTSLADTYMPFPNTKLWKKISNGFTKTWHLNNCVGALDARYVKMQSSVYSGSFSVIIFALCDHECKFTVVDVGTYDNQIDGGILRHSMLGGLLFNEELQLPDDEVLPGMNTTVPYFIAADKTFPLHKHLMCPFSDRVLSREEKMFNYRLYRGKRCIENAFGVMVARFRFLHGPVYASPYNTDKIILACVALHNFIKNIEDMMEPDERKYCSPEYEDREKNGQYIPGEWRRDAPHKSALQKATELGRIGTGDATLEAVSIRNTYKDYVNSSAGEVSWQSNMKSI